MKTRVIVVVVLAFAGCAQERTPSCEEAARHTAEIMKRSQDASKRRFWSDERTVDGQIRFCRRESPNPRLLRCVVAADDEAAIARCGDKFGN